MKLMAIFGGQNIDIVGGVQACLPARIKSLSFPIWKRLGLLLRSKLDGDYDESQE